MEERKWRRWEIAGLFFAIGAGNLLHFVYDRSGGHPVAALFAAVNESVWEHMKLLAVPWLVWTAAELLLLRRTAWLAPRAAGLLTGVVTIPVLYYTYTGALGVNSTLVDILIFQAAVLLAFAVTWRTGKVRRLQAVLWRILGALVLLGAAALFVWWTFVPPQLPLFADPSTGFAGRSS